MAEDTKPVRDPGAVVDLNKISELPRGTKSKLDPEEDAWASSAPPRHDIYCLKPVLSRNGLKYFKADEKGRPEYYGLNIEHRIQAQNDPEVHMYPAFQNLTTRLGRGKQISTAAGFLKKLGFGVPSEADDLEIVKLVLEALKLEKVLFGELDWRGSFEDPLGSSNWQNVASTMTDFPRDPDNPSERLHRMRVTNSKGTPTEVGAQITVAKLFSRKEYKELSESGELNKLRSSFGIGVSVQSSQLLQSDDDTPVKTNGAVVTNKAAAPKPAEATVPTTPRVSPANVALALVEDD